MIKLNWWGIMVIVIVIIHGVWIYVVVGVIVVAAIFLMGDGMRNIEIILVMFLCHVWNVLLEGLIMTKFNLFMAVWRKFIDNI